MLFGRQLLQQHHPQALLMVSRHHQHAPPARHNAIRRLSSKHGHSAGSKLWLLGKRAVGLAVAGFAGYHIYYAVKSAFYEHTELTDADAIEPKRLETGDDVLSPHDTTEPRKRLVVLGSGWGAISLCKQVDKSKYEVVMISPRNYFLMTPLLPSAAVGTLETRAVTEPVRQIFGTSVRYIESECHHVDPIKKIVTCSSRDPHLTTTSEAPVPGKNALLAPSSRVVHDSARTRPVFSLPYDILVVAIGSEVNTFNIPGVGEHAHFLKELPDARRLRVAISDCFESAATPGQTDEERKRLLNFIIVGGGPTGVEFAAELSDFITEDLSKLFPREAQDAKITVIEALDHILTTYDQRISKYTENHFRRQNIGLVATTAVKEVTQGSVIVQRKGVEEKETWPCAMVVWATGIKPRPLVQQVREAIGTQIQSNNKALLVDQYLQLLGAPSVFAIGDCATIHQPKLVVKLAELFKEADLNGDNVLDREEFIKFVANKSRDYPQLELYSQKALALFDSPEGQGKAIGLEDFKKLLQDADARLRALPATAQVANQQGAYLGKLFNAVDPAIFVQNQSLGDQIQELKLTGAVSPFNYRHLGSLAYVGGESAVADFTGVNLLGLLRLQPLSGTGAFWLWRSCYFSEVFTTRNRVQLVFDWSRSKLFGRDITRE